MRKSQALLGSYSELLAKLLEWFGIEFHLVDGATGELVHCAFDQTARDWSIRGELCRAVASRGTAEIIEEEEPLLVIARKRPKRPWWPSAPS